MPKTTPTKTETMTLRISPTLRRLIAEYATAREMTPSDFVRYTVRVYMDSTSVDD